MFLSSIKDKHLLDDIQKLNIDLHELYEIKNVKELRAFIKEIYENKKQIFKIIITLFRRKKIVTKRIIKETLNKKNIKYNKKMLNIVIEEAQIKNYEYISLLVNNLYKKHSELDYDIIKSELKKHEYVMSKETIEYILKEFQKTKIEF